MSDENPSHGKKNYVPPKVTVINLRPEEAVLGHCKNASGGPAGPASSTCTSVGACMTQGS